MKEEVCHQMVAVEEPPAEHIRSRGNNYKSGAAYNKENSEKDALLSTCFAETHLIFTGSYSPERMLHACDYTLDKAFIYAVIAASKWMGETYFKQGLYYDWPPPAPAEFMKPSYKHP